MRYVLPSDLDPTLENITSNIVPLVPIKFIFICCGFLCADDVPIYPSTLVITSFLDAVSGGKPRDDENKSNLIKTDMQC